MRKQLIAAITAALLIGGGIPATAHHITEGTAVKVPNADLTIREAIRAAENTPPARLETVQWRCRAESKRHADVTGTITRETRDGGTTEIPYTTRGQTIITPAQCHYFRPADNTTQPRQVARWIEFNRDECLERTYWFC